MNDVSRRILSHLLLPTTYEHAQTWSAFSSTCRVFREASNTYLIEERDRVRAYILVIQRALQTSHPALAARVAPLAAENLEELLGLRLFRGMQTLKVRLAQIVGECTTKLSDSAPAPHSFFNFGTLTLYCELSQKVEPSSNPMKNLISLTRLGGIDLAIERARALPENGSYIEDDGVCCSEDAESWEETWIKSTGLMEMAAQIAEQGKCAQALSLVDEIADSFEKSIALLHIAHSYFTFGHRDRAQEIARKALANPVHFTVDNMKTYEYSETAARLGFMVEAGKIALSAPVPQLALMKVVKILLQQKKYDEALRFVASEPLIESLGKLKLVKALIEDDLPRAKELAETIEDNWAKINAFARLALKVDETEATHYLDQIQALLPPAAASSTFEERKKIDKI